MQCTVLPMCNKRHQIHIIQTINVKQFPQLETSAKIKNLSSFEIISFSSSFYQFQLNRVIGVSQHEFMRDTDVKNLSSKLVPAREHGWNTAWTNSATGTTGNTALTNSATGTTGNTAWTNTATGTTGNTARTNSATGKWRDGEKSMGDFGPV